MEAKKGAESHVDINDKGMAETEDNRWHNVTGRQYVRRTVTYFY